MVATEIQHQNKPTTPLLGICPTNDEYKGVHNSIVRKYQKPETTQMYVHGRQDERDTIQRRAGV